MAALDATPTLRAVADLDVEAPHDRAHHREIFLILRRYAGQLDGAAAVRTRGRRRCSAGLVNLRRTRAARLPAVVRTSAPAGSPAATLGPVLGEGRGLPESCPPRRVELLLEVFTAALPPIPVALPLIPVALDPRQLLPQPCDLSLLFLNAGIAGILFRPGTLPWHPTVMPDPLEKYKSKMLDLARHETTPLNKYGLALAALVLTKASFAYLWIPIVVTLAAADLLRSSIDWKTAGLASVMLLAQCIPIGGWMARNYLMSGDFSIIDIRSAQVLGLRDSYSRMRHDEWLTGFAYYLPPARANLPTRGIADESFERFEMERTDGFRQTARRSYLRQRAELWHDGNPALVGLDELGQRRRVDDKIAAESIDSLLADPLQQLRVSLLLAWRGTFAEEGLGFLSTPLNQRLADIYGPQDWPRWRWAYDGTTVTLVNLGGLLAMLVVPFWFWLGRGQFEVIIIFLPALYAHGAYAVISHFLPRYAEPQIPLPVTATMLLLFLAWSTLQRLVRSAARSADGPARR